MKRLHPGRGRVRLGVAALLSLGLLGSRAGPVLAQVAASEAATTVLGSVCEDRGRDGRCDPGDPPLAGVRVRTLRGSSVRTDTRGRFRFPVIGARTIARDGAGRLRPRLVQLYLFVDGRSLGIAKTEASGQWVDLVPGASISVHFALPVARPAGGRAPRSGVAAGALPRAGRLDRVLRLKVPIEVQAGHTILIAGQRLPVDGEGRAFVPVPLPGREGFAVFIDRAPDGRTRVMEVRALRVPWENGAHLLSSRPPRTLLTVDLPAGAVAPGRIPVVVRGRAGTVVALQAAGDTRGPEQKPEVLKLGEDGKEELWLPVSAGPLRITITLPGERPRELQLPLVLDPRLLRTLHLSADLRAGLGDGLFGEGRVEIFGELPLLGGRLGGGLRLSDARLLAASRGGRVLSLAAGPIYARVPDPEASGLAFGDASLLVDENPGDATLWGGWVGEAGRVALAPARTPLSGGEVGRFDRATYGPVVELSTQVGEARLGLAAAADAWGVPLMDDPEVLPAHAELLGTGGSFYLLPHRAIAEGSERLFIEALDPASGLPLDRRLLVRGRDYEIDYPSGRILLAAPLGLLGVGPAGRLGAQSLGGPSRLAVDYHHRPAAGAGAGYAAAGARVSVELPGLSAGLQAAGVNAGRYGLLAADLTLEPVEGVAFSASVARSAGDPFLRDDGFATSLDGGERWQAPVGALPASARPSSGAAPGALAFAARLRLGHDAGPARLDAWGVLRGAGFADGASRVRRTERGAGGRLRVGDETLGLLAEAGAIEGAGARLGQTRSRASAKLRARGRLGAFGLAIEGGLQSLALEDTGGARVAGSRLSAGLELSYQIDEDLELLVGHLQGLVRRGSGPAADDPTFSSVGVRAAIPGLGRLEARGGVHPDGRPGLRVSWLAEQEGGARYASFGEAAAGAGGGLGDQTTAGFGSETDRPWDGQGQASVVGGKQVVDARTDLFAESRLRTEQASAPGEVGLLSGTAVGGRWGAGPLSLTATYERAARPGASLGQLRDGLFLRVGYRARRLSLSAFGENTRAYAADPDAGFLRRSVGGGSAQLVPTDAITFALRALVSKTEGAGESSVPGAPAIEAAADLVYRPRDGFLSLGLLRYGVAADPRPGPAGLWHRLHTARAALTFGRGPGPTFTLSGVLAVDEARRPSTGEAPAARALVGTARLSWPLLDRVEPVLEFGLRRLWGAGDSLLAPTVRIEVLALLGNLRVGLGGAITGFTGEGIEPLTGQSAAPRIYLVVRGAR